MAYVLGKLAWVLVRPSNLLLLLALVGLATLFATRRRRGMVLLATSLVAVALVGLLPIGLWLTLPLENRYRPPAPPPGHVDGIVVLGGGIKQEITLARGVPSFGSALERFATIPALAHRYPEARILFTGGEATLVGGTGLPEAEVVRRFLEDQGLPPGRVEFESRARSTRENALLTLKQAQPQPGERWLLVTSAKHMPRAIGTFQRAGWPDLLAWPVDFRTSGRPELFIGPAVGARLVELDEAAYEWFGLLYYRTLGYTDQVLP